MSHVVASEIAFTDLDLLRKVIAAFFPQLEWRENQKKYHWVGRWYRDYHKDDAAYKRGIDPKDYGKCEHALHMDGVTYEIGICKRSDGNGYSLVWDFVGDGYKLSEVIGKNAEKLACAYSEQYLVDYGMSAGFMGSRSEDEENIYVTLEKY